MNCPKCDDNISDSYEPDDHTVGIVGGWFCERCDLAFAEHEFPRELLEGDVGIIPAPPRAEIGTPISQLSGRPGEPGYGEFVRIAKTWGFD